MPWCPKCNEAREPGTIFCPECGVETVREDVIQKTGGLPLGQEGLAQTKFSLLPGENVIIESRFTYYYKSTFFIKGGNTYLTQYRMIFCNNHSMLIPILFSGVAGLLTAMLGYSSELRFLLFYSLAYALCIARKATKITFQLPISQIKSVQKKKYGFGARYTVLTDGGVRYVVQFPGTDKWERALRSVGLNLESLTKEGQPVDRGGGAAATPEPAAAPVTGVAATSPAGMGGSGPPRKFDWLPVVIFIAALTVAIGASVYFWKVYQPAPPKPPAVKTPVEKPVAKTVIPKPETNRVEPKELGQQLNGPGYFSQGRKATDLQQKIYFYTKAIELNPSYVHAYNNRCIAYYLTKDYENALKDCSKAIELSPKYPFCYNHRGIIYYAQKEYDKALSDYNTAISLKPDYAEAYYGRAKLYNQMGDHEQARRDYQKAKSLDPSLPDLNLKSQN
jgi:hypothetical protein